MTEQLEIRRLKIFSKHLHSIVYEKLYNLNIWGRIFCLAIRVLWLITSYRELSILITKTRPWDCLGPMSS